jgi:hypothetical protein
VGGLIQQHQERQLELPIELGGRALDRYSHNLLHQGLEQRPQTVLLVLRSVEIQRVVALEQASWIDARALRTAGDGRVVVDVEDHLGCANHIALEALLTPAIRLERLAGGFVADRLEDAGRLLLLAAVDPAQYLAHGLAVMRGREQQRAHELAAEYLAPASHRQALPDATLASLAPHPPLVLM